MEDLIKQTIIKNHNGNRRLVKNVGWMMGNKQTDYDVHTDPVFKILRLISRSLMSNSSLVKSFFVLFSFSQLSNFQWAVFNFALTEKSSAFIDSVWNTKLVQVFKIWNLVGTRHYFPPSSLYRNASHISKV